MSQTQIRKDIALAKELFKTNHTFDWDFWQAWQIKDQLELIQECKLRGDLKNWNAAKKVLAVMIGQKPEAVDDPRRMEKNVFNVQVNYNGQTLNIDLDKIRNLPANVKQDILTDQLGQWMHGCLLPALPFTDRTPARRAPAGVSQGIGGV